MLLIGQRALHSLSGVRNGCVVHNLTLGSALSAKVNKRVRKSVRRCLDGAWKSG